MPDTNTIQLLSNVKIITSGKKPTIANLLPGQAAFGKIEVDGKYHLFGNTGEGGENGKVVDIIIDTLGGEGAIGTPTLDTVLASGNTTSVDIQFSETDETGTVVTVISPDGIKSTATPVGEGATATTLSMLSGEGFKDNGFAVLSGNPNNVVTDTEKATMRNVLDVLSRTETTALIAGVYSPKGSKDSFNDLVSDATYTPKAGDVWNIKTAGGVDMNGTAIKAGDNVAFVGPDKATDWDVLAGMVDLSSYYNKTEVDGIKTTLETSISAADTKAGNAATAAAAAQTTADAANTAATAAQTAADDAQGAADAAQKTANEGKTAATTAQTTAEAAKTAAEAAQTTADNAATAAAAAQTDVNAVKADYVKNSELGDKISGVIDAALNDTEGASTALKATLADFVQDANYVHTDNNYTTADKDKLAGIDLTGDGSKFLSNDGSMKTISFAVVSI